MSSRWWLYAAAVLAVVLSCKKQNETTSQPLPADTKVFVKDITITSLPSPYYHFEYNPEGKIAAVIVASGIRIYNLVYEAGKISEMRNNTMVNKDRLLYFYDNDGKINTIQYMDDGGVIFKTTQFTYSGQKLVRLLRERTTSTGFVAEREMKFIYQADGNLMEITDERFAVFGQIPMMLVSRFEAYDTRQNTDDFRLLHDEDDHLLLLPGIVLQKNNPGKMTRTGTGLNYRIDYTYTYNNKNIPLTKKGEVVVLSGPGTGQRFPSNAMFSYY